MVQRQPHGASVLCVSCRRLPGPCKCVQSPGASGPEMTGWFHSDTLGWSLNSLQGSASSSGFSMRQRGFPGRNHRVICRGQWAGVLETQPVIAPQTMLVSCSVAGAGKKGKKNKNAFLAYALLDQRIVFACML